MAEENRETKMQLGEIWQQNLFLKQNNDLLRNQASRPEEGVWYCDDDKNPLLSNTKSFSVSTKSQEVDSLRVNSYDRHDAYITRAKRCSRVASVTRVILSCVVICLIIVLLLPKWRGLQESTDTASLPSTYLGTDNAPKPEALSNDDNTSTPGNLSSSVVAAPKLEASSSAENPSKIMATPKSKSLSTAENFSTAGKLDKGILSRILAASNPKALSIGLRKDSLLQECQGSEFKRSFPDLDYSFFGYNILMGYPLANGHDPGFTYPIFRADYTEHKQTVDCRYSVPAGLVVVPDVSCITSFSSKIVQTRFELEKSLTVSANIQGGGFGVSFSASAGYKETSTTISSGKSKFIYSTASCKYYFTKLEPTPPPLHQDFINAVKALDAASDNDLEPYFDFFNFYGTHYPTDVTYGARYTYEYKMESEKFESRREKGFNVAVQAGYSGAVSVSGGFGLDSSQREAAEDFQEDVETKTITVGAPPPANGDAMTWASTVKQSPVPVEYKLEFINDLFTEKYMGSLNVNLKKIAGRIQEAKMQYCEYMRKKGLVDSCHVLAAGLKLHNTQLHGHYSRILASESGCIDYCSQQMACVGISTCHRCDHEKNRFKRDCYLFSDAASKRVTAVQNEKFDSVIIPLEIRSNRSFKLYDTKISGNYFQETYATNPNECSRKCRENTHCVSYSYGDRFKMTSQEIDEQVLSEIYRPRQSREVTLSRKSREISKNCFLFGEDGVEAGMERRVGVDTYIIN